MSKPFDEHASERRHFLKTAGSAVGAGALAPASLVRVALGLGAAAAAGSVADGSDAADSSAQLKLGSSLALDQVHALVPTIQYLEPCDSSGKAFPRAKDFCFVPSAFYGGSAKLLIVF